MSHALIVRSRCVLGPGPNDRPVATRALGRQDGTRSVCSAARLTAGSCSCGYWFERSERVEDPGERVSPGPARRQPRGGLADAARPGSASRGGADGARLLAVGHPVADDAGTGRVTHGAGGYRRRLVRSGPGTDQLTHTAQSTTPSDRGDRCLLQVRSPVWKSPLSVAIGRIAEHPIWRKVTWMEHRSVVSAELPL